MRIAYLAHAEIPSGWASSIHVMKMCQAFSRNGHDVFLLNPKFPSAQTGVEDVYAFYGVDRSFPVLELPLPGRHRWGLIPYSVAVRRAVRHLSPDIVYARCHGLQAYPLDTLDPPLILEAHQLTQNPAKLLRTVNRSRFRHLVVISRALRDEYHRVYGISEALIRVAPDGADEPRRNGASPFPASDRLRVGYVGNLYAGRGIELIIQMARACGWADFHVVGGPDPNVQQWRSRVASEGISNVVFHGFVSPGETDQYRRFCEILVAPYENEVLTNERSVSTARWMSPLKIFEYMAAGRAIMTSDMPALREVLTHGVTAWLCTPGILEEWVAGLEHLRDHAEFRESLGAAAQRVFTERYTWRARAASVL